MFSWLKKTKEVFDWEIVSITKHSGGQTFPRTNILLKNQYGDFKTIELEGTIETPLEEFFGEMERFGQKSFLLRYAGNEYIVMKQEKIVVDDEGLKIGGLPVRPPREIPST